MSVVVNEDTGRTPASSPARGVGALDRVAQRLADEAGVRLSVAESPAELIGVHRLRYRDAAQRGRATAQDDRDGLERDVYDVRALQLCAWDGEKLVGTLRVVLPMVGKRLPTEEQFGLTVQPAGEVVDVGRPLIAPELGGERARRAADGLLAQAWFETRARGYTVLAGIASEMLVERYRSVGLAVELLARREDGLYAVRLDPSLG
jgi:hypothetical protein